MKYVGLKVDWSQRFEIQKISESRIRYLLGMKQMPNRKPPNLDNIHLYDDLVLILCRLQYYIYIYLCFFILLFIYYLHFLVSFPLVLSCFAICFRNRYGMGEARTKEQFYEYTQFNVTTQTAGSLCGQIESHTLTPPPPIKIDYSSLAFPIYPEPPQFDRELYTPSRKT